MSDDEKGFNAWYGYASCGQLDRTIRTVARQAWEHQRKKYTEQLTEKDKEIEDRKIEVLEVINQNLRCMSEYNKLNKKLEIALEALEFYSHEKDREGWGVGKVAGTMAGHRYDISCAACNEENRGMVSRQALEKIKQLESEK